MSRKTNRLKNRLRIEREQAAKREDVLEAYRARLSAWELRLRVEENRLRVEEKNLNRSVALRIRVEQEFGKPRGEAYALHIVFYPREYVIAQRFHGPPDARNISRYAAMRGHEAGEQIQQVIFRCLTGELEEFLKAK